MVEQAEGLNQFFEIIDLPQTGWETFWEDIVIWEKYRRFLLNYADFMVSLDETSLPDWNIYKNVSFQGPPGTGKTTLALGYANEMAKRWRRRNHSSTKLLRLKAEGFFSHLLGATAKTIAQTFDNVPWLARRHSIVILIDEVESLALTRKAVTANPHEPSDLVRGVNTLLTQVDRIRHLPGVLLLTTSNLSEVIDEALVSRTDLTIRFALPDASSRARIIETSLDKLRAWLPPLSGEQYAELARLTAGFSGRDLVRLAFWGVMVTGKEPRRLDFADFCQAIAEVRLQLENQKEKEEMTMEDTTRETDVLERYLSLGGTHLPGEAAQILVNTLDRLAQLTAFPGRQELGEALLGSQKCLTTMLAAQLLHAVEVCFAGEVLRITFLYFPDPEGREDNLDLSILQYTPLKTEEMEIRFRVTEPEFARFLGIEEVEELSMPGLKFSVAPHQDRCLEERPEEGRRLFS